MIIQIEKFLLLQDNIFGIHGTWFAFVSLVPQFLPVLVNLFYAWILNITAEASWSLC